MTDDKVINQKRIRARLPKLTLTDKRQSYGHAQTVIHRIYQSMPKPIHIRRINKMYDSLLTSVRKYKRSMHPKNLMMSIIFTALANGSGEHCFKVMKRAAPVYHELNEDIIMELQDLCDEFNGMNPGRKILKKQ